VHARLLEKLRGSAKLFADETTVPVLDPGRGRTRTGQLWAYARDDRPWRGSDPPAVAYVYAPDRTYPNFLNWPSESSILRGLRGKKRLISRAGGRQLSVVKT